MPQWIDCAEGAGGLRAVYGGDVPALDRIEVHEVLLIRDAAQVVVRFDMAEYPLNPPKKWRVEGFNAVQVQLAFVDCRHVSLNGWGSNIAAALSLDSRDERIRVSLRSIETTVAPSSIDFSLSFTCAMVYVKKLSAYLSTAK